MIMRAQLRKVNTQGVAAYQLPDVERQSKLTSHYYKAIMKRNIFGSQEEISVDRQEEEIEDLQPTSLKLALLGTVSGNRQNAFAVIQELDKKRQALYRIGDSVQGAMVKKITRGKVILRVNERDEMLTIEAGVASRGNEEIPIPEITNKGATKIVDRSDVQASMKNLHRLLSQVRVRPHFRNGKADGLLVTNIKPGSFFAKLGLRNGDIVQGIDNRMIKSPDDVLEVYKKFRLGSQAALKIMRNNKQKTINYEFR